MSTQARGAAKRLLSIPVAAMAVFLMSSGGCPMTGTGGQQEEGQESGVTDVRIENFSFVPKEMTIRRGEAVRWRNYDLAPHTATSGSPGAAAAGQLWESGMLLRNQSFTRTFNDVGEFTYYCRFHVEMPGMRDAKVIVVP